DRVDLGAVLHLVDIGEFCLYASEKDMHDAIMIEPSLVEEGFRPVTMERPVESGFVDILGVDREGILTAVEVKRKAAGRAAVFQLEKYVKELKKSTGREVRGILVSPEISKGVQGLLATLNLEFKSVSPKRCAEILGSGRDRRLTGFLQSI
ncbi:MAG: endonuclease NucS domain-containing protein, partial [Candidatus Bathyarchaeia archaeon]